jgi:anti-sigma factor RsiW
VTAPPINDDDIHAYADGLLPDCRRAQFEAAMALDPDLSARVAFYRRLNRNLHRLYDGSLAEPTKMPTRNPPIWRRAAIAAGIFLAGLLGGWIVRDLGVLGTATRPPAVAARPGDERDWPIQAARAHATFAVERRHPVEVAADEEAHLVQWLSNRLGQRVVAPKLEAQGFRLVGGRLLPRAEGGVAGQFMYERVGPAEQGAPLAPRRITLYVKPTTDGRGPGAEFEITADRAGNTIFHWLDDRFGYALVGAMPRETLLPVARAVFDQLAKN